MASFEPAIPAPLRGHVARWVGYDFATHADAVHHGLPSTTLTVILAFDEPLDVRWPDDFARGSFWTLASGLHRRPAMVHTPGHQQGIQLELRSVRARCSASPPGPWRVCCPGPESCRWAFRRDSTRGCPRPGGTCGSGC